MSETTTATATDIAIEAGKAPPPRIDIHIGNETKTVFMSFALLNLLTPLVGGPERIAEFDFNSEVRELAVIYCIAPRDEKRKIPEDYKLPDELALDETETLLEWVKGHVLSFFIRRILHNIKLLQDNGTALQASERLRALQTS